MTRAVVYFNKGTKCLVRMALSIASLREVHKDIDVVVYNQGEAHPFLLDVCESFRTKIVTLPDSDDKPLVSKVFMLKYLEHDHVVFLDADTLVLKPLDQLFSWTEEHGMVFVNFEDWFTRGKTIQGRIVGWRGLVKDAFIEQALNYGTAINTGVFGIKKNHPMIDVWCDLVPHGAKRNLFIPDEISAQILIPSFPHYLAPKEYNRSARYGRREGAVVAHYHGRKHVGKWELSKVWRNFFWEQKDKLAITDPLGDKVLADHMRKTKLPIFPYTIKRAAPEVEKAGTSVTDLRRVGPWSGVVRDDGPWLDIITTVVPRGTVRRAMESFHQQFDKENCKLRWVVHLDYVEAMQEKWDETLQQISDVAPLFDEVRFHQRDGNVGHGLSLKWCFMQSKHHALIWEDDKIATRKFSYTKLQSIVDTKSPAHITFLHRGVRPGSTSPSWWSRELIQHQLDNWPAPQVEEGDSELAIIRNSRKFGRRMPVLPLGIQDIGIQAQADMGVVRQKKDRASTYKYKSADPQVTFVTSCDAKYLPKLQRNAHNWKQRMNIMSYPVLVFIDDSVKKKQIKEIFPGDNVKIVKWDFPIAGNNQREKMLSGFIYVTAKHVKTPYWVKIDADVELQQRRDDRYCPVFFEDWFKYDLVGHKWGYTRVKGDPDQTRHWLNVLDDWWIEKNPDASPLFPPDLPVGERVGHPRIASFYCMQSTKFTKEVAALCGGRLPVPSHDTLMWYVAEQTKRPILRTRMKQLGFSPR